MGWYVIFVLALVALLVVGSVRYKIRHSLSVQETPSAIVETHDDAPEEPPEPPIVNVSAPIDNDLKVGLDDEYYFPPAKQNIPWNPVAFIADEVGVFSGTFGLDDEAPLVPM